MSQASRGEEAAPAAGLAPVVVKKYANRRLYNTASSAYITLDVLAEMVRAGRDFVVRDARSGEDITRAVLTQIVVEEEARGHGLLPVAFLRQLIGFYGDSMQGLVPRYLEQAMANFARQQAQMRAAMQTNIRSFFPLGGLEEAGRQNMAMIERAMSLFSPVDQPAEPAPPPGEGREAELAALRSEVESLRRELAAARAGGRPSNPLP